MSISIKMFTAQRVTLQQPKYAGTLYTYYHLSETQNVQRLLSVTSICIIPITKATLPHRPDVVLKLGLFEVRAIGSAMRGRSLQSWILNCYNARVVLILQYTHLSKRDECELNPDDESLISHCWISLIKGWLIDPGYYINKYLSNDGLINMCGSE